MHYSVGIEFFLAIFIFVQNIQVTDCILLSRSNNYFSWEKNIKEAIKKSHIQPPYKMSFSRIQTFEMEKRSLDRNI